MDQNQQPLPNPDMPAYPPVPPAQPPAPLPPMQTPPVITRHDSGWIAGLVLIVVGGLLILQNYSVFHLNNWWALFILIPAISAFSTAWNGYRSTGRWTRSARGSLIGGCVFLIITAIFLFDLSWGLLWPIFLIIGGLAVLFNGMLRD